MKRALVAIVAAGALAAAGADAKAGGTSAHVDSVATVLSAVNVVFDFDLYDCPAGLEIVVVDWEARQPSRVDSGAAIAGSPHGLSNGDPVQHLSDLTGSSSFLPGERWVGSGHIACGPFVVPVEGSGATKSLNGV